MDTPRHVRSSWHVSNRFLCVWFAVVAILVLVVFPAFTLWNINWFNSADLRWVHEIEKRKRLAAKKVNGEKVILAGGSSALFGLDAVTMERELGRPVLNMGTHAGMGLRYLLCDARDTANPGDTVILQLEMEHFTSDERLTEMEEHYAWTYQPTYFLRLPVRTALASIYGQHKNAYVNSWYAWNQRLRGNIENGKTSTWNGYPFVQLSYRGDFRPDVFPRKEIAAPQLKSKVQINKKSAVLSDFVKDCRARHINVLAAPPIHPRPPAELAERYEERLEKIEELLRSLKIPILGDIRAGLYPPELMADTPNHLSGVARQMHTSKMIGALRKGSARDVTKGAPIFLAAPHECWFPAEIPSSQVRCITQQASSDSACVTLDDVRRMREAGQEIYFASEEVAKLLRSAFSSFGTVRTEDVSVSTLLRTYQNHLFAIATLGEIETFHYVKDVELPWLRSFLRKPGSKAAIFGTGRYSTVPVEAASTSGAFVHLSQYAPVNQNIAFPMDVSAKAGGISEQNAGVMIAAHQFSRGTRPGIQIVVVDPGAGIVTFSAVLNEPVTRITNLRRVP